MIIYENILSKSESNTDLTVAILKLFKNSPLDIREQTLILSSIIIKIFAKNFSNNSQKDLNWSSSDSILADLYNTYKNFILFYNIKNNEIFNKDKIKKDILKIIFILISENIIFERKRWVKNKSIIEWSLNLKNYNNYDNLNIHFIEPTIIEIGNTKYLKGKFFTHFYDIFQENPRSGEIFEFSRNDYLIEQCKFGFFINNSDLNEIIRLIENREKIIFEQIPEQMEKLNVEMKNSFSDLNKILKENKEKFYSQILANNIKKSKNFINIKLFLNNEIIDFILNFISKKKKNKEEAYFIQRSKKIDSLITTKMIKFIKYFLNNTTKKKNMKKYEKVDNKYAGYEQIDSITNSLDYRIDMWATENEIKIPNMDEYDIEKFNNDDLLENKGLYDLFRLISKKEFMDILEKNWKNIEESFKYVNDSQDFNTTVNDDAPENDTQISNGEFLYNSLKLISDEDFYLKYYTPKNNASQEIQQKIKNIQKILSKLYIYNNIRLFKELKIPDNKKIYMPFFYDFRGRQYYNSPVGPTNSKIMRYVINYGIYEEKDFDTDKSNWVSRIIKSWEHLLTIAKKKFEIKSNKFDEIIFWCLIAIGKIKIDKREIKIGIERFILQANTMLLQEESFKEMMDEIEYNHYIRILKSLNDEKILKRVVLKDATASFLQNMIRLLGPKDESSLEYANLKSDEFWYDSYSFILNKWFESDLEINKHEEIKKIFNRKTVKKTIMTNPYSATYVKAFDYFAEEVFEQFGIKISHGSEEARFFKKFHTFIEKDVEEKFFLKNSSKKMIDFIKQNIGEDDVKDFKTKLTLNADDAKYYLIYYIMEDKSWDLLINFKDKNKIIRKTKLYKKINKNLIDHKKISNSLRANWIHSIDALLIREINKILQTIYITIHDCFLIDINSVTNFILAANIANNKKIMQGMNWNTGDGGEIRSIFIFI